MDRAGLEGSVSAADASTHEPQPVDPDILKSSVAMLVTRLLMDRMMYGYELIGELRRLSGGQLALGEGTLYPTLHRLERRGLLRSERLRGDDGRLRRYYTATPAGRVAQEDLERRWNRFRTAVDAVLDRAPIRILRGPE